MQIPPYNPFAYKYAKVWAVPVSLAATKGIARNFFLNIMEQSTIVQDYSRTRCRASVQKEISVYCFLFLWVLRCFTSPGAHPHTRIPTESRRVSPFGNFRVKGYLAPHRNLSQPYHVLHRFLIPRYPPYTLYSCKERWIPLG
jgi:hypothetical protein